MVVVHGRVEPGNQAHATWLSVSVVILAAVHAVGPFSNLSSCVEVEIIEVSLSSNRLNIKTSGAELCQAQ